MLAHSHVDESLHTHIHMKSVDFSGAKFKQGAKESLRIVIIVKSVDRILFFYDPLPKDYLKIFILDYSVSKSQCISAILKFTRRFLTQTHTHTHARTHAHTHTHTFPRVRCECSAK